MERISFIGKLKKWINENKIIILLSLLFFFIRLPFLDQFNLLHDERDISLSGYSIARTGKDLSGVYFPLSISNIAPDNPLVSIYYSALWWLIPLPKTVFNARLPFVFITSFLVVLIYSLIAFIVKDKRKALLTTLVCCFSPWLFHLTRLSMDIGIAFMTLIVAITLQAKKNKFAYVFYILTFYNYQGFRVLIPFIIFYVSFFFENGTNIKKALLINIVFLIFLFGSIQVIDKNITLNRFNQIIFLNKTHFDNQIIFNRNTSLAPASIKALFDNKIVAPINYVITGLIKGQDITYLFKDGDYSAINGSISGGQFLFPLIIFYYLGIVSLGKKCDKNSLFIIGLIPLGMLPALVSLNGTSFAIRGITSSIGYSFLIAGGITTFTSFMRSQNKPLLVIGVFSILGILFSVSLSYFIYTYYFRRPVLVGEMFNENERKVSEYIIGRQDKEQIIVASNSPKDLSRSYLFFLNTQAVNTPVFIDCKELKMKKAIQNTIILASYDCINDGRFYGRAADATIGFSDYSNRTAYYIFE
ncbi:MAG: hypothetical protein WAV30_03280 [Microgenomates group bacterium]